MTLFTAIADRLRPLTVAGSLAMVIALTVQLSCGGGRTADVGNHILAEGDFGEVTLDQFDSYVRGLPPGQRWRPGEPADEQAERLLRQLALRTALLREARLTGADQDAAYRELERNALLDASVKAFLALEENRSSISQEAILIAYQAARERYRRVERREVFQIFLRADRDGADALASRLRQRLIDGEDVRELAREFSDSETAVRFGRVGFVQRGQFSKDLDEVVFALEIGVPSQVLRTSSGLHLFMVRSIQAARDADLQESRFEIADRLRAQEAHEWMVDVASQLPKIQGGILTNQALDNAFRLANPEAILARVGNETLTLAGLERAEKTRAVAVGSRLRPRQKSVLLRQLFLREAIYAYLQARGPLQYESTDLQRLQEDALFAYFRGVRLRRMVAERSTALRGAFDANPERFARPPKVRLSRLELLALEGSEVKTEELLASLNEAREKLDQGRIRLGELAERYGGSIRELPWLSRRALAATDPLAARVAFVLEPGQHSSGYIRRERATRGATMPMGQTVSIDTGVAVAMIRVEQRLPPERRTYPEAEDDVIRDYIERSLLQLHEELLDEVLSQEGYTARPEAIELIEQSLENLGREIVGAA